MQVGRSADQSSPIIFDGQGRIYTADGKIILDKEGVRLSSGELFKVKRSDFELLKELGAGQYGTVWAVRHIPSNTQMALKVVKLSLSHVAVKQIMTELDILVRAKNPFIVDCYGAFCSDASAYFCMELLDAGSLEKIIPSHPINENEDIYRAIAYSVICGLKFLRDSFSVIHRDIKPSNILIGRDGRVKICDFGVSGYLACSLARTRVGTSNYMAPERISLGCDELGGGGYGAKSDVWSVGATLMEMAVGSPPFPLSRYDCVFAQLMDIIHSDPPEIHIGSLDFRDFVSKCLCKDPKDRPNYAQLLEHSFLSNISTERVNEVIKSWINLYYYCIRLMNA